MYMAHSAYLKDLPVEHRWFNEPPPLEGQAEILNSAHLLIRDTSDHIVFWNSGAEDLYGWTGGEALGQVSHDLFQTQFPESLASIRAQLWRDSQWKGELLHRRRDGEQIAVASHWVLHRNDQGLPRAILEVNNDITELKHSEQTIQQLNTALANAMPGISKLDARGRYTEVNEHYAQMLGYASSELLGKDWRATVYPEDQPTALQAYERLRAEGKAEFEAQAIRKDGSVFFQRVLLVAITDPSGKFAGHYGFMCDITDRKHEEQIHQQTDAAIVLARPDRDNLDGHMTTDGRAARTKIIVVNMPDAQERRSRFAVRARNATVAWSFFSAYSVLHPALTYTEQEAIVAKGRPLREGELGCYSSHYAAWESLQADDADQYIVLEDDVIVDWAFIGKIVGIDFAAMGINYLRLYYKRPVEQSILRQTFVDHSRWIVELLDYAFGTQGYLITKSAAKTLMSQCRIVRRPVDDEMDRSWAHGVPNLAIVPFPIIEESAQSTIGEARFERFAIPRHLKLRRFVARVTERLRREAARLAAKFRRLRTGQRRQPWPMQDPIL